MIAIVGQPLASFIGQGDQLWVAQRRPERDRGVGVVWHREDRRRDPLAEGGGGAVILVDADFDRVGHTRRRPGKRSGLVSAEICSSRIGFKSRVATNLRAAAEAV
jgi:hypothetical protein